MLRSFSILAICLTVVAMFACAVSAGPPCPCESVSSHCSCPDCQCQQQAAQTPSTPPPAVVVEHRPLVEIKPSAVAIGTAAWWRPFYRSPGCHGWHGRR
jgi:hypothetical protein